MSRKPRDLSNPSRDGVSFVRSILKMYVKDWINDGDYARLERELLDVIQAERQTVLRALKRSTPAADAEGR